MYESYLIRCIITEKTAFVNGRLQFFVYVRNMNILQDPAKLGTGNQALIALAMPRI